MHAEASMFSTSRMDEDGGRGGERRKNEEEEEEEGRKKEDGDGDWSAGGGRERERMFRCPSDESEKEGISRLDVADWSSRW